MNRHLRARSLLSPRVVAPVALLVAATALGGCSHKTAPPHVTGLTGLGATSSNWDAVHSAIAAGSTYGPTVSTGVGSEPTYSGFTVSGGHVAGWIMAFANGTRLVAAEHLVSRDLPSDTQQIASARQERQSGSGACEVVSYQSVQLKLAFPGDPNLGTGKFNVSFYDVGPGSTVSTSYAKVNRAVVAAPAATPPPTCP